MQADPQGSMDDWVKLAYDDVDPRIWPVAKRSLLAHVERIQSLGGLNHWARPNPQPPVQGSRRTR
jgi:hypothetical protein